MIGETPYANYTEEEPKQLPLFEYQEPAIESEALEKALLALQKQLAVQEAKTPDIMFNSLLTFNLAPNQDVFKHLRKAKISRSAEESIASDWAKVSKDVYSSFLKNALEVNRGF